MCWRVSDNVSTCAPNSTLTKPKPDAEALQHVRALLAALELHRRHPTLPSRLRAMRIAKEAVEIDKHA